MKCPNCGSETRHFGTSETLVGYPYYVDEEGCEHHHNDNCEKRVYRCKVCKTEWVESIIRTCDVTGCGWTGKTTCACHSGVKVKDWSDPEDYYIGWNK